MKIAMVTTDFFPNIGGVAQHIYELARALVHSGDTVEIIAPAPSAVWSDLAQPVYGDTVNGIPVWRIPFVINQKVKFLSGQISGRLSKRRFNREVQARLESFQPDLIHWHALDVAGCPMETWPPGPKVWTNHTSNFIEGIKTSRGLRTFRREAAAADEIICPSEELADLTVSIGIDRGRVHFISNGVDSGRFHPGADGAVWRDRLVLAPGEKLVLCPRRLEVKNGVRYFIEAALRLLEEGGLPPVKFAVAGNFHGPKRDSDEDLARGMVARSRREDRVVLLGRVENRDMPALYSLADVVVMPSLIEATSLSAMEAMSTAKPLVSTNVGGLPFLVRDGENGILVPPRDAEALAEGIRRLLRDPEMAARMGRAGRARVEAELDWAAIARQTQGIYERARARHKSSGR